MKIVGERPSKKGCALYQTMVRFFGKWRRSVVIATVVAPILFAIWNSLPSDTKLAALESLGELYNSAIPAGQVPTTAFRTNQLDVVFLIDGTVSMHPYIVDVYHVLDDIRELGKERGIDVMTGAWMFGSIDGPLEAMPLSYGSPEGNLDRALSYQASHDNVFCSQVDFCEDQPILATIVEAIEKTKWREPSNRLVVVIADWPDNSSGDENAIRPEYVLDLAASKKTYMAGIRLTNVQALEDQLQRLCGGVNASISAPCLDGYAKEFSPLVMDVVERHLARIEPHIH